MNLLAPMMNLAGAESVDIFFKPVNFFSNLKYMGTGMVVIFVVISLIILTITWINYLFSE